MALLQIRDRSTEKTQTKQSAIGIDLGTTNSLVATVNDAGQAEIIPIDGHFKIPSIVHYPKAGFPIVGEKAKLYLFQNPENTFSSIKRLMGRSLEDVKTLYPNYPYTDSSSDSKLIRLRTPNGEKTPIEISATILKVLAKQASTKVENSIGAVITVPAHFDDAQRQATKDAAELAGINVLRLLNEPTAAAVAYGLDHSQEGIFVIYDLGGGTFDLSILKLKKGVFEVIATGGDTALGGDDFDAILAKQIQTQCNIDTLSHSDWATLIAIAKDCKEKFSEQSIVKIKTKLEHTLIECDVNRESFFTASNALTEKTISICEQTLKAAQMKTSDIDGIVMVGGSTRLITIKEAVKSFFGQDLYDNLDPDKAVALGAAAQANVLAGNQGDWLLLDVTPLSLGLETMGGLVEKIIPRHATIPTIKKREFTNHRHAQTAMRIHVLQGERELCSDCRSLATFTLANLPPMAAGQLRIEVSFQIDADGLLSVSAIEKTTGVSAKIEVKPSYGLTEKELQNMLESGYAHAKDDQYKRRLIEQKLVAEQTLQFLESLFNDQIEMDADFKQQLIDKQKKLSDALLANDLDILAKAEHSLSAMLQEIAMKQMNQDMNKVLMGQKVEDIDNNIT